MYQLIKTTFSTNHMSIQNNHIKPGNFKLKPSITRKTGKLKDQIYFTSLILNVKSTQEHPFPVDILVDFRGIFHFKGVIDDTEVQDFLKIEAVKILYPYLRSMVSTLTINAMMPPIVLPVIDVEKLFANNQDNILIN